MTKILRMRCLAALACVALIAIDGGANAQARQPLSIGVFAYQYIAAGRSYDDLNALEAAVRGRGIKAVRLEACGATDSFAQRAAAHRFRDMYMELSVLDRTAPACGAYLAGYLMPAKARVSHEPTGIDKAAVDAWWHALMP